ncbi:MAG: COG1361 S-layer family protein [Acetivibrionales bacterium]|jgi:hypothetical protein
MMKKLMLKRTGTTVILLIFLFTSILSLTGTELKAYAASDFVLTHGCTRTLEEGDSFTLAPLEMKNLTDQTITNIQLDFSKADIAVLASGGTIYDVDDSLIIAPNDVEDLNKIPDDDKIHMKFIGDGSSGIMTVTVIYSLDGGDTFEEKDAKLVLNVERSSASDPTPPDPSELKPNIMATVAPNASLNAGKPGYVSVTLKNISTTSSARDILFTPLYGSESPFISVKPTTEMPIKRLDKNESTELKLLIDTDKFSNEGLQPLSFELTYKNARNYEITTKYTVYINVVNFQTNCKLRLELPSGSGVAANAGSAFDLPLVLKNDGNLTAKDVRIIIKGLSQETFTLVSGTGRYDFDRLYGNETRNLSYSLRASSSLRGGSHPITFSLVYYDEKGSEIREEQEIWIPVAGSGGGTVLEVLEVRSSMATVKPGETFNVVVKLKNSGAYDSGQIKISADGTASLLPVSQNLHIIQSLKKGEIKNINFNFQPKPDAPRGGVPITISVEPVDNADGLEISQAISVFVDSDSTGDSEGKNVPKVIIKSYSSEPTLVNAGETFQLHMEFLNTHASKTVRNIKGSFSVTESSNETGNVFTPVGSSNTFYIDKISPQGTSSWDVTLYTIPDAKSKTYTVDVAFEYEDDLGTQYTATEMIGIPVYQPSRFEVSEFYLPPEVFMGEPLYISFEMYNLGKTEIYNVKMRIEGDFEAQPKSNYFGNFESGRVEYFELNLIPMTIGECNGRVILQYENASGEVHEVVKDISMNVMEMMMPPDDGFPVDGPGKPGMPGMEDPSQQSFFKSVWFYVILGIVAVGIVVAIILVVRKRKKDKEFEF